MTSIKQMVITLFIVALACSVILSFVYSYTSPRIDNTRNELLLANLREAIAAQNFVEIIPDTVWQAYDSADNVCGIVFRIFPQGYGAPIPITVGLSLNGMITGIRIATAAEGLKETPGLGTRILESDFKNQFIGKQSGTVKLKQDGGEIDGITAATISSRAVCNGIRKGFELYGKYLVHEPESISVFPEADIYIPIIKDTLWYALYARDTVGIVFVGTAQGYAGEIRFKVGLRRDTTIAGITVLASQETEGFGERIREQVFLDKFKQGRPEAITGATISSQAFIDAVQASVKRYAEYLK